MWRVEAVEQLFLKFAVCHIFVKELRWRGSRDGQLQGPQKFLRKKKTSVLGRGAVGLQHQIPPVGELHCRQIGIVEAGDNSKPDACAKCGAVEELCHCIERKKKFSLTHL